MSVFPLLIQFVLHPTSEFARNLARHIHRQLNDDVIVPGLRIPTVFCPFTGGGKPPESLRLDIAQHSFVVPLADDELCVDDDWCRFVADVWEACHSSANGRHRCVPMQLTKDAWPLDDRLREVNFGRAFALPDEASRNAWVSRRVVIELCRFLRGLEVTNDQSHAPTQLFLSHAKADLGAEPKVAIQMIDYYDNEPRITGQTVDDSRSIVEFLADAWTPKVDRGWETSLNPLTRSQNLELFETVDLARMVEVIQVGLSSLN